MRHPRARAWSGNGRGVLYPMSDQSSQHRLYSRILQGLTVMLIRICFRPKVIYASEEARQTAFSEPRVMIYNHVRGMDAAVIYSMLRCPATALSAQDLVAQYPILRLLYKVFPMLRIDREHASLSWLRESRQLLRSGQHVMIAPEGKCSPKHELLPFKPGCVMLAAASGTKILPIYHNGEYHYLFGRRFRMIVGEPIAVTPAPDGLRPDEMNREAELLHDAMLALAKQLDSPAL